MIAPSIGKSTLFVTLQAERIFLPDQLEQRFKTDRCLLG